MSKPSGSFADLRTRVLSAIAMAVVGLIAIWAGGITFLVLLSSVAGLMIWELLKMLGPDLSRVKVILLSLVGGAAILPAGADPQLLTMIALLLAPVLGMVSLNKDRALFLVYSIAILFAVAAFFGLRESGGLIWTVWLILVVIAADVGGYFFGRIIGGPKILPIISPKKTWSGILGGWLLAGIVGAIFWLTVEGASGVLISFSVFVAFASQIGDIAESAIKRHSGVKDSSSLIPGHGGVLDRFDALIGASLVVFTAELLVGLSAFGLA